MCRFDSEELKQIHRESATILFRPVKSEIEQLPSHRFKHEGASALYDECACILQPHMRTCSHADSGASQHDSANRACAASPSRREGAGHEWPKWIEPIRIEPKWQRKLVYMYVSVSRLRTYMYAHTCLYVADPRNEGAMLDAILRRQHNPGVGRRTEPPN